MGRGWPVRAQADHASVLDGGTLRVSGRVRPPWGKSGGTPRLELWLRRQGLRGGAAVPLGAADVEPAPWGRTAFEATAALAVEGGRSTIGPGDWGVYLHLPEPDRGLIAVQAPRPERDAGPTLLNPRSPETGLWYRLHRSLTGRLFIEVTAFPAHAEVERVGVRLTELAIEGRVVGTALSPPAGHPDAPPVVLRFLEQASGEERFVPVRVAGDRFTTRIDPELFTVPGKERCAWRMALAVPGKEPLALGRYLDDLRKPAAAYRYPAVVTGSGSPNATRLQVTYADDRQLVLHGAPAAGEDARS